MASKNIPFHEHNLSVWPELKPMLLRMVAAAGKPEPTTVPQIFADDDYIGSYEELKMKL